MKTFREEVERVYRDKLKYHEECIEDAHKSYPTKLSIAEVLDEEVKDVESYYVDSSTFSLTFKDLGQAREMVGKLLIRFPQIEKFEKNIDSYRHELKYHFEGVIDGVRIKISPSDAPGGCVPKMHTSASTYWLCERQG